MFSISLPTIFYTVCAVCCFTMSRKLCVYYFGLITLYFYMIPILFYWKLLTFFQSRQSTRYWYYSIASCSHFLLSRHSTRYRYYSTASSSHSLNGTHDSLRPPHYTSIYTVPIFFYCKLLLRLKKTILHCCETLAFFCISF